VAVPIKWDCPYTVTMAYVRQEEASITVDIEPEPMLFSVPVLLSEALQVLLRLRWQAIAEGDMHVAMIWRDAGRRLSQYQQGWCEAEDEENQQVEESERKITLPDTPARALVIVT
jgi:hypothetical protein